jgi:hypothetical protein
MTAACIFLLRSRDRGHDVVGTPCAACSRPGRPWPCALGLLIVIGLVDAAADLAFAVASRSGALRAVSVLSSLYPVVRCCLLSHSSENVRTRRVLPERCSH